MEAKRIGVWTIRLMRAGDYLALDDKHFDNQNQKVHDEFNDVLSEVEAFANEQLPDGFYVKIDDQ